MLAVSLLVACTVVVINGEDNDVTILRSLDDSIDINL